MKLDEIVNDSKYGIHTWTARMGLNDALIRIEQGQEAIIVNGDADLGFKYIAEKIPFKFKRVGSLFSVSPNPHLTSFENFPEVSTFIDMSNTGITSLVGIDKVVKETTEMYFQNTDIREGGIGLLNIEDLRIIECDNDNLGLCIIKKYIGKPNSLFDCQAELIEAGLEEFAKL